ncbi:MAG: hypothetical protein KIS78_11535 [Labilithrix sp.]|nr:hypothetical protein [Labilithrix sp.]MCW5833029.1 hypothetical protein [Labilithrix sp.]
MTRHVTNPQDALARAIDATKKVSSLVRPGVARDAYEAGASAAKTAGNLAKTGVQLAATAANIGAGSYAAFGVPAVQIVGQTMGVVGATLTATPVGIGLAVVNAAHHLKAVYSTAWHIKALTAMRDHAGTFHGRVDWRTREATLRTLDYTIRQKQEKTVRRSASATPGVGVLATLYSTGRGVYKSARGTKGKDRTEHAVTLVAGLKGIPLQLGGRTVLRFDYLAFGICIELLGEDDFWYAMATAAQKDWDLMVPALLPKLKST